MVYFESEQKKGYSGIWPVSCLLSLLLRLHQCHLMNWGSLLLRYPLLLLTFALSQPVSLFYFVFAPTALKITWRSRSLPGRGKCRGWDLRKTQSRAAGASCPPLRKSGSLGLSCFSWCGCQSLKLMLCSLSSSYHNETFSLWWPRAIDRK